MIEMPPRAFCLSFTFTMSAESSSASAIVTRPPRDHIGECLIPAPDGRSFEFSATTSREERHEQ